MQNLFLLNQTQSLRAMHTIIRDKQTSRQDFIHYANRLNRLLLEEAFNHIPYDDVQITTPVNDDYVGIKASLNVCGVSIMRAGESMESELRAMCPAISIGKILIQRDEETKKPCLFYTKLPKDIKNSYVLVLEPMLATGGSAGKALDVLHDHGVPYERMILITVLATEQGIAVIHKCSDKINIVTSAIDQGLNSDAYIVPGIGDYGDRYFGTD